MQTTNKSEWENICSTNVTPAHSRPQLLDLRLCTAETVSRSTALYSVECQGIFGDKRGRSQNKRRGTIGPTRGPALPNGWARLEVSQRPTIIDRQDVAIIADQPSRLGRALEWVTRKLCVQLTSSIPASHSILFLGVSELLFSNAITT